MELTVYRVGDLVKASDYDRRHELFVAADALRPAGSVGRLEGLFCSPTKQALDRWRKNVRHRRHRQALPLDDPIDVWQLTVQVEQVEQVEQVLPVYSCVHWEAASDVWEQLNGRTNIGRLLRDQGDERERQSLLRRLESCLLEYWSKTVPVDVYQTWGHSYPFHPEEVEMLVRPEWIVEQQLLSRPRRRQRLKLPRLLAA